MQLSKNRFSRILAVITTVYIGLCGIVILLSAGSFSRIIDELRQLLQLSSPPQEWLLSRVARLIACFTQFFSWTIGVVLFVMLLRGKKDKLPGVFFLILGGYVLLIQLPSILLRPLQTYDTEKVLFAILYWLCYGSVFCLMGIGCLTPNKVFSGKQGIWLPLVAAAALLCYMLQNHYIFFYLRNLRLLINTIVLLPYDVLLFSLAYCLPGRQKVEQSNPTNAEEVNDGADL